MPELADVAVAGMNLIAQIVEIVESSKAGKLDPDVALGRIATMQTSLAANRAAADAIVDQRFPK